MPLYTYPHILFPVIFQFPYQVMNITIHTAIVMGTQAEIHLPPAARDTRVLSIMLLLRMISEVKLRRLKHDIPLHVVGENQEGEVVYFSFTVPLNTGSLL